MSTRSVVAEPLDNGFRGRYVHGDGYPTARIPTLLRLIEREGRIELAKQVVARKRGHKATVAEIRLAGLPIVRQEILTKGPQGWSYLTSGKQIEGVNVQDAKYVDGYGLAYADGTQDWEITQADAPEGLEWAYILNDRAIGVLANLGGKWDHVGDVDLTDPPSEKGLVALECGEDWSRCKHYAWAHDPDVPRDNRIGMRAWVGLEPRGWDDIEAVSYCGSWYELTGSGGQGTARSSDWRSIDRSNRRQPLYWWASVKGLERSVRLARVLKDGSSYKLDRPVRLRATKQVEANVVQAGTVLSR